MNTEKIIAVIFGIADLILVVLYNYYLGRNNRKGQVICISLMIILLLALLSYPFISLLRSSTIVFH